MMAVRWKIKRHYMYDALRKIEHFVAVWACDVPCPLPFILCLVAGRRLVQRPSIPTSMSPKMKLLWLLLSVARKACLNLLSQRPKIPGTYDDHFHPDSLDILHRSPARRTSCDALFNHIIGMPTTKGKSKAKEVAGRCNSNSKSEWDCKGSR